MYFAINSTFSFEMISHSFQSTEPIQSILTLECDHVLITQTFLNQPNIHYKRNSSQYSTRSYSPENLDARTIAIACIVGISFDTLSAPLTSAPSSAPVIMVVVGISVVVVVSSSSTGVGFALQKPRSQVPVCWPKVRSNDSQSHVPSSLQPAIGLRLSATWKVTLFGDLEPLHLQKSGLENVNLYTVDDDPV